MTDGTADTGDDATIRSRLDLAPAEEMALLGVTLFALFLIAGVLVGVFRIQYLLFLLSLTGMYALLTVGLNVQWGYAGLVNFSVIAFWGIGAYSAALLTATRSPLVGKTIPILGVEFQPLHPSVGLFVAVLASVVVAVLIAIPTLRLRADYLAIATLGFAEVIRLVILNEVWFTGGSHGITGLPFLFEGIPLDRMLVNFLVVVSLTAVAYLFVRRIQLSPWGRVLRTIRADEDLAKALGKNTFRFKLQAFVVGSVVMSLAGVFYVYLNRYVDPGDLAPIRTFYVWIGVILGGTGSNRGAILGGVAVVAILEGTRFVEGPVQVLVGLGLDLLPYLSAGDLNLNFAALRLLFVGVLVILVVRYRPAGLLPPGRELVWPDALGEEESR